MVEPQPPDARDATAAPSDAAPFLKWAGGKGATAEKIIALLPHDARDRVYREPFLGGGAVFFRLQPRRAWLSDSLDGLVAAYRAVRATTCGLIHQLQRLRERHSKEAYYEAREEYNALPHDDNGLRRAALFIYLNKTCFNGLHRTNRRGQFNVPYGKYKNPSIYDERVLYVASDALARGSGAMVSRQDFSYLLDAAMPGDLIYMDPPYVPASKTSSFTAYASGAWSVAEHRRLAEVYRTLDARGCLLALSQSDTPLVRELYAGYDMAPIQAPRSCAAKGASRGSVTELLIRNVARYPR